MWEEVVMAYFNLLVQSFLEKPGLNNENSHPGGDSNTKHPEKAFGLMKAR